MSQYEQPIMDYIASMVAESGGGPVAKDTLLLETGAIDSIGMVRLVQFLEERFGLKISDSDLTAELFESPASLTAYVEAHAG
ncbi:MAG: acyl carrier protein [Devosia sp.]